VGRICRGSFVGPLYFHNLLFSSMFSPSPWASAKVYLRTWKHIQRSEILIEDFWVSTALSLSNPGQCHASYCSSSVPLVRTRKADSQHQAELQMHVAPHFQKDCYSSAVAVSQKRALTFCSRRACTLLPSFETRSRLVHASASGFVLLSDAAFLRSRHHAPKVRTRVTGQQRTGSSLLEVFDFSHSIAP